MTDVGDRPGTEVVQADLPLALGTDPRPLRTLRGAVVLRGVAPGGDGTASVVVAVPAGVGALFVGPSADPGRHRRVDLPEAGA